MEPDWPLQTLALALPIIMVMAVAAEAEVEVSMPAPVELHHCALPNVLELQDLRVATMSSLAEQLRPTIAQLRLLKVM
jgi:hypothetical protein